jgi:Fic family protein
MGALAEELTRGPTNRSVLEFAATVHTKLVTIHPFFDGNGRTARLLLNAVLVHFGWPAITVRFDDRDRYLLALEKSNNGNIGELISLFIGLCKSELEDIAKEGLSLQEATSSEVRKVSSYKEQHVSQEQVRKRARQINFADFDDPLAEVLNLKEDAERSLLSKVYEDWFGLWLNFLTEIKTLCKEVGQAPQYATGGVVVNVHDFGVITFESFCG